jgi:hypothetical protein
MSFAQQGKNFAEKYEIDMKKKGIVTKGCIQSFTAVYKPEKCYRSVKMIPVSRIIFEKFNEGVSKVVTVNLYSLFKTY